MRDDRSVLEILDREGVRATFFQIGNNVRREPNLAAEVASPDSCWSCEAITRTEMS